MGKIIPTGLPDNGHSVDFEYVEVEKLTKCFMVCKCGWKIEIESFRNSWSLTEIRVKHQKHLEEFGVKNE